MAHLMDDIERVLLTREQITQKVEELAAVINEDYKDKDLVMIGILKGAVMFFADLFKLVKLPVMADFMSISSYGKEAVSSGVVKIIKDLDYDIEGKHLLIVEDIVDTGLTLKYLIENLRLRGAASVKTITLLDKVSRRKVDLRPDYRGFEIEDSFVVGYGLDYAERYRNLPDVCVLKPKAYQK